MRRPRVVSGDKNGVILMWDIGTEKGSSKDVAPSARFEGHSETVLPSNRQGLVTFCLSKGS